MTPKWMKAGHLLSAPDRTMFQEADKGLIRWLIRWVADKGG